MSIPDDVIERVRDAADIVQVIGGSVELKRTGSDYRGPCPFHGGTHRNLAVIPKKQMFYCFVCHEAGDVFSFYMKRFGMDYPTAVREVARQVGIAIPDRPSAGPDPLEPLYSAVAIAAEWYARRLREADDAKPARAYLESRGFPLEQMLPHGLGFAPKGEAFLQGMETFGIEVERLFEAGLAVKREDDSIRPRFWNRLLFPIHDLRGRVVGFGGRVLGDQEPKYLNSPDSPIFHKGKLLYHLHEAKHPIRKAERAVVVEGYFDVLRLAEVGIEEVVAPLGTALTADQAALLKRYAPTVVLLYDSDSAGLRATFRSADELLRQGLRVLVATPPPGQDPDMLAQQGGRDAVAQLLDDALDVLERKLQLLERKGWLGTVAGRRRALDRLLPTLHAASDAVTRDLYIGRTAEALGVSAAAVQREVDAGHARNVPRSSPVEQGEGPAPIGLGRSGPERELVHAMLKEPRWRARVAEQVAQLELREGPDKTLIDALVAAGPDVPPGDLVNQLDAQPRQLLLELLDGLDEWNLPNVDELVGSALARIQSRPLEAQLDALERRMTVASEQEKMDFAQQIDVLSRQIRKLNPGRWNVIRRRRRSGAR